MNTGCFIPHILWLAPLRNSEANIEETKGQLANNAGTDKYMISSMILCEDGSSVVVCTNWRPVSGQQVKEKKSQYVIPLDYMTLKEEAQQLVEASFHLSMPTCVIFDLRTRQQQQGPLDEDNESMRMLLYMVNIVQIWRKAYKQGIFSILIGSCSTSFLLSKWSLMLNLVEKVKEEELPNFLKSLEKNIFLWKGALFVRSSSTWLGSGIVRVATDEHPLIETRSLWLFFRQLEPVCEIEQLNTDAHRWHTITLPCEFHIDDQESFNAFYEKKDSSASQWFRITFRNQKGVSRSCLLYRQVENLIFQMQAIIPITCPGYFGFVFATVAKQLHAMALYLVSQSSNVDFHTKFATIWKRHIERMDRVVDIQLFWHQPLLSCDPPCLPFKHMESFEETRETSKAFETQSPESQWKIENEKIHCLSMPIETGVVKRRKRALHKLSLRTNQRQYIDSSLSIHQRDEVQQASKNRDSSFPQEHSPTTWMVNEYHIDSDFIPLYDKVIEYWFSLLGQHLQLDVEHSKLLQYPFMSNACDEVYQSLAKAYHQLINHISNKANYT